MTDQEPTQKELQKFWEWCGFKHSIPFPELAERKDIPTPERFTKEQWYIVGIYCGEMPELTLDNLFKYAVPKLKECEMETQNQPAFQGEPKFYACVNYGYPNGFEGYSAKNDKPELALFRAIQEVVK